MSDILIECRKTGRHFSTGIVTDKASFDVLRDVTARALCPYCDREHEWRKRDAWLDDTPASELIENQAAARLSCGLIQALSGRIGLG